MIGIISILIVIGLIIIIFKSNNKKNADSEDSYIPDISKKDLKGKGHYTVSEFRVEDPEKWHQRVKGSLLQKDLTGADPTCIFYNKKVVITGELPIDRIRLAEIIKYKMGADIDSSLSVRTSFLIVGDDYGPAKLAKANDLIEEGCDLQIIESEKLMDIIQSYI